MHCARYHKSRQISIALLIPRKQTSIVKRRVASTRAHTVLFLEPPRARCNRHTRQLAAAISVMNRRVEMSSLIYRLISISGKIRRVARIRLPPVRH